MATYERRPLMTYKDKAGHKYLFYPITKAECVDGLDTLLAGKESPAGAQAKANAVQGNLTAHNSATAPHANMSWAKKSELSAVMPIGAILLWSGLATAIPAGWKLCDGTNGTPDLRGRFVAGAGGTYAVGDTGGLDSVSVTVAQIAAHGHTAPKGTDTPSSGGVYLYQNSYASIPVNGAIGSTGGNQPHENRPPYYALCYIMFKGV